MAESWKKLKTSNVFSSFIVSFIIPPLLYYYNKIRELAHEILYACTYRIYVKVRLFKHACAVTKNGTQHSANTHARAHAHTHTQFGLPTLYSGHDYSRNEGIAQGHNDSKW